MPIISFRIDDADLEALKRVEAKYRCSRIQAFRLGVALLDEYPLLQVNVPARHKTGPKAKSRPKKTS